MSSEHAVTTVPPATPALEDPTLGRLALAATRRHSGAAIRFRREDGHWADWSYEELGTRIRALARGIVAAGIQPGERIAVLSSTRPEWALADAAILAAGCVVVPIYHTNSPEECRHVIAHSGSRAVICEDAAQAAKIHAIEHECPELEHIWSFTEVPGVTSTGELESSGSGIDVGVLDERLGRIGPEDIATIVYTSGTTGLPKGCMLSHRAFRATVDMYEQQVDLAPPAVVYLFLPLAHALARVASWVVLHKGATTAYWRGDVTALLDDLDEVRPTHFPSVPRVYEKVHTKAIAAAADGGRVKKALFDWALATGRRWNAARRAGTAGSGLRLQHELADRLVLSKIRDLFGGRLRMGLVGAAPIGAEVLEFFDACGLVVLEGFGLTETCAAATLNTVDAVRLGTVGRPLPGTEVTISDDGEVLLRGANVFSGYHRDEDATAEVFRDGWFLTGDLGELDADGFLRITGRRKDLIITSSGKNVTPTLLESALRETRWISQAVVYGDRHSYLVALLTLDAEEAPALAEELGIQFDIPVMSKDPRVHEALSRSVDEVNARFARIEQVKRFGILDHDLTQGGGALTPTLKVKRNVVYERYGEEFEKLYA